VAVVADDRTGVASPMKLLEYMAMARAVVAPQLPNIRDVAEHERTALLFHAGDTADLSRALLRLASAPAMRESLGHCARATVCRDRTWRRNAEAVVRLAGRAGHDAEVT
jgi:glycosyltransferase involved in cell wall biosynthesis